MYVDFIALHYLYPSSDYRRRMQGIHADQKSI